MAAAPAKSMAERSQAERAGEIPPIEHAGSNAALHIRAVHADAGVETSGDRGPAGRRATRVARSIKSSVHKSTYGIRATARMTPWTVSRTCIYKTNDS